MLLILGAQGQVGRAMADAAHAAGIPCRPLGHAECDVTDIPAVERAVADCEWVVNGSAYTAVDRAETEVEAAHQVNAVGAANIARACRRSRVPLIHLSTDYVFDGEGARPALEDDPPRPLNAYGESKLAGERAVREALPCHIILRTSWVFAPYGRNFVRTMLRIAQTQRELKIVADQTGGPTAAAHIAAAILAIMAKQARESGEAWGTYHFSGTPAVSWWEFARAILANSGVTIVPITSAEYPQPALRPKNSVLDCGRILRTFGIPQPDWRLALPAVHAAFAAERALSG
ncbi:MAG: dTDP-4-dehydrorhamnose reductase [Xanthobacteraceae bacterium]